MWLQPATYIVFQSFIIKAHSWPVTEIFSTYNRGEGGGIFCQKQKKKKSTWPAQASAWTHNFLTWNPIFYQLSFADWLWNFYEKNFGQIHLLPNHIWKWNLSWQQPRNLDTNEKKYKVPLKQPAFTLSIHVKGANVRLFYYSSKTLRPVSCLTNNQSITVRFHFAVLHRQVIYGLSLPTQNRDLHVCNLIVSEQLQCLKDSF